jgi:hypothetical protein
LNLFFILFTDILLSFAKVTLMLWKNATYWCKVLEYENILAIFKAKLPSCCASIGYLRITSCQYINERKLMSEKGIGESDAIKHNVSQHIFCFGICGIPHVRLAVYIFSKQCQLLVENNVRHAGAVEPAVGREPAGGSSMVS